ncbi:MAG TPA: hypothetical protein VMB34_24485 [Acetobacteraceae bacterium]|nr:hypothetical protein [Acetobacteraceae bacterium]
MPNTSSGAGGGADTLQCGEVGTYADLKKKKGKPKGSMSRDHIPSKAALKEYARNILKKVGKKLSPAQARAIEDLGLCVVVPSSAHRGVSPTYGGRNTVEKIQEQGKDGNSLKQACKDDTDKMLANSDKLGDAKCKKAYMAAADKLNSRTAADYDAAIRRIVLPGR